MKTDYKELLLKYMRHVAYHEGTDFIGRACYKSEILTDGEWEKLLKLRESNK